MSASIPAAPTLLITAGDSMNYGGTEYIVSSVGAGSDNGQGLITYSVVLTGGPTITCSYKNTVLSSKPTNDNPSVSTVAVRTWVQNATI